MLKTSLVITGDASVAKREVADLKTAVDSVAASSRAAAPAAAQLDVAQKQVATSAKAEKAAIAEANAEIANGAQAARAMATANAAMVASAGASVQATSRITASTRAHTQAINDNDDANRRHQAGAKNFYQQLGDTLVMVQGGIDPIRAFTTQSSQMGYALSEMGGKAGVVGGVLSGPLGLGLSLVLGLAAPFAAGLFNGANAAEQQGDRLAEAAKAADSYGNAQSLLGGIIDFTTGKLKTQNAVLIQTIKLQAQANIVAAQKAREEGLKGLGSISQASLGETASDFGSIAKGVLTDNDAGFSRLVDTALARGAKLRGLTSDVKDFETATRSFGKVLDDPKSSPDAIQAAQARFGQAVDTAMTRVGTSAKKAGRDVIDAQSQLLKLGTALTDQAANRLALGVANGGPIPDALKPYSKPSAPKNPPKPKSTAAVDEFGRDAADRIAGIADRFSDVPPVIRQITQAGRELDDLIDDLATRKPPGFDKLIADAREAKTAIEQGINKPFDDYLAQQQQALELGALAVQGRTIEAEALRAILGLEKQQAPLNAEQRASVLGTVAGLRQQERQLERIKSLQQVNLNSLQDMQGIITQSIYEGPQSLADLPGRLLDSFKRFQADLISEQVFGEMFRDLRDQVLGANKVDQASNTIVAAFDDASRAANTLATSLAQAAGEDAPIVVTGTRIKKDKLSAGDIYGERIASILREIGIGDKRGTPEQQAKDTAATIGRFAGKALAGSFEGQMAGGVASMLGIKTSSTGSAIGGAIGGLIPGLPFGGAIGGLVGGVLGGLFKKSPSGGVAITGADAADASYSGSGKLADALTGDAATVQQQLAQIAESLGGTIGKFSVSIGKSGDWYHVGPDSTTNVSAKHPTGAVYEGKDQAAALAVAIQDAIADGAIGGISAAVQKALKSSTDLDKALKEALKVQEVELISGGIAAEYAKAFRDVEGQAKDRLRIATQYGFDIVAVEKRNAEDRAKVTDQLLKAQAGSLQGLVDELTSGSLFEGTAMERIAAINDKIAKARTDATAGVGGAVETLSSLLQQRLEVSKEAYGTTGAYAADRMSTLNEAQAIIARTNAQIVEAQAKSDPALATTNAALDENNDQNAQLISELREIRSLIQSGSGGGTVGVSARILELARV